MKCKYCGEFIKDRGVGCDWRQGRCPHREPLITSDFLNKIKEWLKKLIKQR